MEGIDIRSLTENLTQVHIKNNAKPINEIPNLRERLEVGNFDRYAEKGGDLLETVRRLPLHMFSDISFDELCKIHYSSIIMLDNSVCKLFDGESHPHRLVWKIGNSMWRWGVGADVWNEVVESYNGIRAFSLDLRDDFELRLDFTTGPNPRGYSEFSRTYLDGVFAFLVYFRGKHVMTIGFSITEGRRVLLQQVQLIQKKGNRFLYRFPDNYLEFVVECFKEHFPGFEVCVVDGNDIVDENLDGYTKQLVREKKWLADTLQEKSMARNISRTKEIIRKIENAIEHLKNDRDRLVNFYNNIGSLKFKSDFIISGCRFRIVS